MPGRSKYIRSPAGLALLLLVLTVLVFAGGGWYVLQVLRQSKERDLGHRLEGIGGAAASVRLNGEYFFLLERTATPEIFQQDPLNEYQVLIEAVKKLKSRHSLRAVMIIDQVGRVLVDSEERFELGEEFPLFALDQKEIVTAFSGEAAGSPLYRVGDNPHKRCYAPLENSQGEVTALLLLEASRDYFQDLARIKAHLYWLGIVVIALLSLVTILFYKLLKALLRTEETLAMADRLQSLGALAAGLAHEIRNPLSIIRASAESASDELPPEADQQSLLTSIIDEADRMNDLMTRFLQFAGTGVNRGSPASCKPDQVIESVVSMVRRDFEKKDISIITRLDGEIRSANIDEKILRQVLLNLILNAAEAIGKQGDIRVSAGNRKKRVFIHVIDNGGGIPAKKVQQVFDPFFTTKDKGTGLGLFVSRMLIERAGGRIQVSSNHERETRVSIELPIS